jgi:hypothetical protein
MRDVSSRLFVVGLVLAVAAVASMPLFVTELAEEGCAATPSRGFIRTRSHSASPLDAKPRIRLRSRSATGGQHTDCRSQSRFRAK